LREHQVHAPQSWFALYVPKCQYDPVTSYPGAFTEALTSKPSHCLLRSTRDQLAIETVAASRHPGRPYLWRLEMRPLAALSPPHQTGSNAATRVKSIAALFPRIFGHAEPFGWLMAWSPCQIEGAAPRSIRRRYPGYGTARVKDVYHGTTSQY
jgi:hypothetical protein